VIRGFHFLRFKDEVTAGEQFQVAPSVPGFGGRVNLRDEFRTDFWVQGLNCGLELRY
jgi:hypothetical protein